MRENVRLLTEAMPGYFADKKRKQAQLVRIAERKSEQDKDLEMLGGLLLLACLTVAVLVLAFDVVRP